MKLKDRAVLIAFAVLVVAGIAFLLPHDTSGPYSSPAESQVYMPPLTPIAEGTDASLPHTDATCRVVADYDYGFCVALKKTVKKSTSAYEKEHRLIDAECANWSDAILRSQKLGPDAVAAGAIDREVAIGLIYKELVDPTGSQDIRELAQSQCPSVIPSDRSAG